MTDYPARASSRSLIWPCEQCEEEATFFAVEHNLMPTHIYMDDENNFHRHDPNKLADVYKCINGHYTGNPDLWIKDCPVESCGYGK